MGNSASVGNDEFELSSSVAAAAAAATTSKDGDETIIPPKDVVVWAMVTIWTYLIRKLCTSTSIF
jgi:hypothetical protein